MPIRPRAQARSHHLTCMAEPDETALPENMRIGNPRIKAYNSDDTVFNGGPESKTASLNFIIRVDVLEPADPNKAEAFLSVEPARPETFLSIGTSRDNDVLLPGGASLASEKGPGITAHQNINRKYHDRQLSLVLTGRMGELTLVNLTGNPGEVDLYKRTTHNGQSKPRRFSDDEHQPLLIPRVGSGLEHASNGLWPPEAIEEICIRIGGHLEDNRGALFTITWGPQFLADPVMARLRLIRASKSLGPEPKVDQTTVDKFELGKYYKYPTQSRSKYGEVLSYFHVLSGQVFVALERKIIREEEDMPPKRVKEIRDWTQQLDSDGRLARGVSHWNQSHAAAASNINPCWPGDLVHHVSSALEYLSRENIVHRNMQPQNIFFTISPNDKRRLKFFLGPGDYYSLNKGGKTGSKDGSSPGQGANERGFEYPSDTKMEYDFMLAPEERAKLGPELKSDIWRAGLLFAQVQGQIPLQDQTPWDWELSRFKAYCSRKGFDLDFSNYEEKEDKSPWLRRIDLLVKSGCLGAMVGAMLRLLPGKRPTAAQMLEIAREHAHDLKTLFELDPTRETARGAGGRAQQATGKASTVTTTTTTARPQTSSNSSRQSAPHAATITGGGSQRGGPSARTPTPTPTPPATATAKVTTAKGRPGDAPSPGPIPPPRLVRAARKLSEETKPDDAMDVDE
ncbi:hypothetical protein B0T26DRAFT_785242 [Lasiosphaeria miniovina]|uniref:non-specific serine/threonine protein kinase n=1 Tax=Lasiosphaeria miniovina TaxID=1954250 RepID=A0AA40A4S7_9PEZI|nr:uncharacterized protein B0T26DRAFT_785242 [Lasiosphaeria miniovina]KAK0709316.1 hypothetical protein B0T26DRAFT_785242 [Lasiosphaeria miniovina]